MTEEDQRSLRERLQSEIGQVQASDLIAHVKRGAVVIVSTELDLLEVALAVAEDNVTRVRGWIEGKQMQNPSLAQIETWVSTPEAPFKSVIVRPYVLVQPVSS